ncbi:MAG: hypothetical protein E7373_00965 [Clostridiales bacterium]|nr:hypothetical protein [Clostridiales bacterium]
MIKGKNKFLTILLCSFFSCVVLFGITLLSPNMTKVSASGELSKDFYVTGAQIRTDDTVAGIRYNIVVGEGLYNSLIEANGQGAKIDFGAYIAPTEDIDNIEALNASFPEVLPILSKGNGNSDISDKIEFKDGYAEYQVAVMYDIDKMLDAIKNNEDLKTKDDAALLRQAFKMDLTARPFYKVYGEVNGEVKEGYGGTADRSMRAIMDAAVIDGHVTDSQLIGQYLGNITESDETVYYDVLSGQLQGYKAESDVTYAWKGKPVTLKASQDVLTLEGVGEVESGEDAYLSVFDENCNVKRIPVKCISIIDSAEDLKTIFDSPDEELNGYYKLAKNIDAESVNLSGGIRQNSLFTGTFDGCGYTITNLNVSGTSDNKNGSLFGQIKYPAVIENVAFENVTADYAAVISNKLITKNMYDWSTGSAVPQRPVIKNVYIQVKDGSTGFRGVIATKDVQSAFYPVIENVVVKALECDRGGANENVGSFFGSDWFVEKSSGDTSVLKNNYVISNLELNNYWGIAEYDTYTGIKRYATVEAMQGATNDYSSFSEDYWNTDSGIPAWNNTTSIPEIDAKERVFDLSAKKLDVSGLGFEEKDITAIEINGVNFAVTDGVLPELTITASNINATKRVTLTGDNLSYVTTFEDAVPAISVKVTSKKGTTTLTNVKVYSQVIDNETEFEKLFKAQEDLNGVYALGANIGVGTTLDLSGGIRQNNIFTGIFDGRGYTVKNLNVSGASDNINGSLFGQIRYPAVIANVAFENVSADYAAVISSKHLREYDWNTNPLVPLRPVIKNVYIQVEDGSTGFRGVIATVDGGMKYPVIENVIVKALACKLGAQYNQGSFFGSETIVDKNQSVGDTDVLKNNYVISNMPLNDYYGLSTSSYPIYDNIAGITRYATVEAMQGATNDYSSFSEEYWEIVDGIPTWIKK